MIILGDFLERYLALKWPIVPLESEGKLIDWPLLGIDPALRNDLKYDRLKRLRWEPTADLVRQWLHVRPDLNIGLLTGALSGILVIDVDGANPVIDDILRPERDQLPQVRTFRGRHYYFQLSPYMNANLTNAGKPFTNVDIRCAGAHVVTPDSQVRHGYELNIYAFNEAWQDCVFGDSTFPFPPDELVSELDLWATSDPEDGTSGNDYDDDDDYHYRDVISVRDYDDDDCFDEDDEDTDDEDDFDFEDDGAFDAVPQSDDSEIPF